MKRMKGNLMRGNYRERKLLLLNQIDKRNEREEGTILTEKRT
jgi:hypothetical protein